MKFNEQSYNLQAISKQTAASLLKFEQTKVETSIKKTEEFISTLKTSQPEIEEKSK